jgi:curved DNA-binding protein
MAKDYYRILEVSRDATDDQVKRAYRKLAMEYHPDRNAGKETWANDKFKEINEAYAVLGNPEKRRQYDRFGTTGDIADIFGSPGTRTTFEDLVREFGSAGLGLGFLEEIFGDIVRRSGSSFSFRVYGGPGGSVRFDSWPFSPYGPTMRKDVKYELSIRASEARAGTRKLLNRNNKTLEVKVPPGVRSGTILKLSNACQVTDGHPGDIILQIKVRSGVKESIISTARKYLRI